MANEICEECKIRISAFKMSNEKEICNHCFNELFPIVIRLAE